MIIHKGNLSAPMGYRNNIPIWDGKKVVVTPPSELPFYLTNISNTQGTLKVNRDDTSAPTFTLYYSYDNTTWQSVYLSGSGDKTICTVDPSSRVYLRAVVERWCGHPDVHRNIIRFDQDYKIGGRIVSLLYGANWEGKEQVKNEWSFCYMFGGQTHLIDAGDLILPEYTNYVDTYNYIFRDCTNLIKAPYLPTLVVPKAGYYFMFSGCRSLAEIRCNATDVSAAVATTRWLENVSSTGVFYKNASMNSWSRGVDGIPTGWTVVDL